MIDIILDTLLDFLKLLPFLYLAFLVIEFIEDKLDDRQVNVIEKSGRLGPLLGGLLGLVPQCGFSVAATNLYTTRIISFGTLIAIYLSTSDEMLPILLSNKIEFKIVGHILLIKVVIAIIAGFVLDLVFKKKNEHTADFQLCEELDCHCETSIFKSALKHTANVGIYIIIVTLLLNIAVELLGLPKISGFFTSNPYLSCFVSSLIGLIPNCGSSVVLTQLYVSGIISIPVMMSGLLTNSGLALLVLFKMNKDFKENLLILLLVYFLGSISGLFLLFVL